MSDRFAELERLNRRNQTRAQFDEMNISQYDKMKDQDLAWYQSLYNPEDPQYIYIQNIWSSRLLATELKSMRYATWAGILGTLGGVLLGYLLK